GRGARWRGSRKRAEGAVCREMSDRGAPREGLWARLPALPRRWARAELLAQLESVGVPAGPINALDQVFADPQVIHRGMRIERASTAAKGGTSPGVRPPTLIRGTAMAAGAP